MNLKHAAKIINASNNGEDVQFFNGSRWETIHFSNPHNQDRFSLLYLNDPKRFRIKPKDQYRPLTIKDLPPACWISHPNWNDESALVVKAKTSGVFIFQPLANHLMDSYIPFKELMTGGYFYSANPDPTANPELCRKLITE